VKCGAFESQHASRASAWASLDAALERGASTQRDKAIGQENLFGSLDTTSGGDAPKLIEAPEWTDRERLAHEKELLGFYVTGHPLAAVSKELARYTDTTASSVEGKAGREVRIGGLLVGLRETRTKRGARMAFGQLEDLEGGFELVIFSDPFNQHFELLKAAVDGDEGQGPIPLILTGTLEAGESEEAPKLLVRDVMRLSDAEETLSARLRIAVLETDITQDRMLALRDVLRKSPGDCEVVVNVTIPGESVTVMALGEQRGVRVCDELCREVNALFGRPVADSVL